MNLQEPPHGGTKREGRRRAGRMSREPLGKEKSEWNRSKKTPEQQFFNERFHAREAFSELRKVSVTLRRIPNPENNPYLEERNGQVQILKNRIWSAQSQLTKGIPEALERVDQIKAEYEEEQAGEKNLDELSADEVVGMVRDAIQKKKEEVLSPGLSPSLLNKMMRQISPLKKITENCQKMIRDIQDECSWQDSEKDLLKLQQIDEAFPNGFGVSALLLIEKKASSPRPGLLNPQMYPGQFDEIGKGAFGKVFKTKKANGEEVAMKSYLPGREGQATHEYDLLRIAKGSLSDHLVLPKAVYRIDKQTAQKHPDLQEGQMLVEYPFIKGRKPLEYLNDIASVNPSVEPRKTSEKVYDYYHILRQQERQEASLKILIQTAEALQSMHNNGLIHQDAKPENILIDEKGDVKLFDMGEVIREGEQAEKLAGSPRYMHAKALSLEGYKGSSDVDVYALGVMAYVLLSGKADPFHDRELLQSLKKTGLKGEALKTRFFFEMGLKKEIIEDSNTARMAGRDPFFRETLKKEIFRPSEEMILLIQRATGSDHQNRMESMEEYLEMLRMALRTNQLSLEKTRKRQERSTKTGSDRYSRKKLEEEKAREEEEKRREKEKEEREKQNADPYFGINQTRVTPPKKEMSEKEKPKPKPNLSKEDVKKAFKRRTGRSSEFY